MSAPLRIVITGGSGGLGSAAVEEMRKLGHFVLRADLSPPSELPEDEFIRHDVSDEESWARLHRETSERFGGVDCLVNNAGVSEQSGIKGLTDTSGDAFSHVLQTNLWGTWCGIKTFSASLAESNCASIINVSSIYGIRPPPRGPGARVSPAYQVSKAGIAMLTRTAATELADYAITVNCIVPGVFETPLLSRLPPEALEQRINAAPLKRAGDPRDFGSLIAFLAGPNARFITGTNIPIDGGFIGA